MTVTDPSSNIEYAVSYTTSATGLAARLRTLQYNGPLLVAKEHMAAVLLPEALDFVTHAPRVAIAYSTMVSLGMPGLLLETELYRKGTHFAVKNARWA